MQKILIAEKDALRLDRYLSEMIADLSRSYLKKLIQDGRVELDGKKAKASESVKSGMQIIIDIPEAIPTSVIAENIDLDVVYEDEWLIIINKPQGMVVHPAAGHHSGTLVHALLHHCDGQLSDLNGVIRPGIVHRIDKDTSGLLLVVKNNQVHTAMAEQIRSHTVERIYQAVVYGSMQAEEGSIEAPIGRDPKHRQRMAVVGSGKPSLTHFKVIKRLNEATHVEARLESGRTHQIRVHFKYIGHPVIGDPLYASGRKSWLMPGQALHAGQLSFNHPATGRRITVTAPLPEAFINLLQQLS